MTNCARAGGHAWTNYPFLTQKERDNETGLDYFINRYYSSMQGRFTSADPLMASAIAGNPQSWNRYAYVLNNPTRLVDRYRLEGEDPQDPKPEPQDPPAEVVKVNVNDTKIHSIDTNLIDKVDHYGDKRVPVDGTFEITYSYSTTAPPDGTDPSTLGRIAPVTTATGKPSKGTLGSSQQVERVGEPLVIVNHEKEKVEVTKTERFKILRDETSTNGGTWVINYQVVVSSPTSGQVVSASTLDKKSVVGTGRIPKPIPVVNKLKKGT